MKQFDTDFNDDHWQMAKNSDLTPNKQISEIFAGLGLEPQDRLFALVNIRCTYSRLNGQYSVRVNNVDESKCVADYIFKTKFSCVCNHGAVSDRSSVTLAVVLPPRRNSNS